MITISQSVGRGGRAKRGSDVLKVQTLLNQAGAQPKVAEDGAVGPNTIRAIEQHQRAFTRRPDGRVDPGGKTIRRLMGNAGSKYPYELTLTDFASNSLFCYFSKFDDPSRGYRDRLGGTDTLVLRDGLADATTLRFLFRWMVLNRNGAARRKNLSVIGSMGGGLRRVNFIDVSPVQLIQAGMVNQQMGIREFTIRYAKFEL
jgi:hypothetical protein